MYKFVHGQVVKVIKYAYFKVIKMAMIHSYKHGGRHLQIIIAKYQDNNWTKQYAV